MKYLDKHPNCIGCPVSKYCGTMISCLRLCKSYQDNKTEMNYEEKYKEALEWMRSIYPTMQGADKEDAEHYFPELKESEDERIRKAIICGMNALKEQHKETFASIPINNCIAWLEKQGDKDELIKELGEYKAKYTQEILEKHLRTMNKDDERLRKTTIAFLKDFAEQGYENAIECIDWLEKQGEQKSSWSEEDERMLGKCIDAASGYYSPEDKQSMKDWLKSLKDRVQPQPKQNPIKQDTEAHDLWVYIREWNDKFGRLPKDEDELAACIDYVMKRQKSTWSEKHIADVFENVGLAKIVREQGNDQLTNAVQSAMIELSKLQKQEWSE